MNSKIFQSAAALVAAIFLSACVKITYENAMPQQSRVLLAFTAEMQGKYVSAEDPESYIEIFEKKFATPDIQKEIGVDFELRPYQKYFVANLKDDDGWLVYLAEWESPEILTIYAIDAEDEESLKKLAMITEVQEFRGEDGELERIHIAPKDNEFKEMLDSGLFLKLDSFHKQ